VSFLNKNPPKGEISGKNFKENPVKEKKLKGPYLSPPQNPSSLLKKKV